MSAFPLQSHFFDKFFSEALGLGSTNTFPIDLDWKETPEAHIFRFDLPGVSKDEVKLQIHDDRVLHITADRKDDNEDNDKGKSDYKWHCKERSRVGSFEREFRLPEDAVVDQIKASLRDGVLVVTVAKDQHKKKNKKEKSKHKAVEIAGDDEDGSSGKGLSRFVCCKA